MHDYMINPLGKGNSAYPGKQVAKGLTDKYNDVKLGITHKIYLVRNDLYIMIKLPSSIEGIYYDVLFAFTPNKESTGVTVLDMDFKVLSNCPSFVYTFAHAYNKRGLVITNMQKKLTKLAIQKSAEMRNQYDIPAYERSVFMSILHILDMKSTNPEYLKSKAKKSLTIAHISNDIQDFESLMIRREAKEKQIRERIKEENSKAKVKRPRVIASKETDEPIKKAVTDVKMSNNTKTASNNKSTKNVKRVKKK